MDVAYSDIDVPSPRINHTKSGAIVSEPTPDGLYHMYFGDSFFYHATSPDMLNWTALPPDNYFAAPLNPWENRLIEPGPAPIKTRDGRWILVYNGLTTGRAGCKSFPGVLLNHRRQAEPILYRPNAHRSEWLLPSQL